MFKVIAVLIALQGATLGRPQAEWGLRKETLGTEDGVAIAPMDTGARETHEALRDNFAGSHGWFDPSSANPTPTEDNGHGTPTIGIIAGGGATWFDPAIEVNHVAGIIPVFSNGNNGPAIEGQHTAGIIPVFSNGNNGPSSNTDNSPGDRNLIGDGFKTEDDQVSSILPVD